MHVVRTDGRVASAGDAVIELMLATGGAAVRRRARLAKVWPPLRRKIDRDYRRLAERRGELSGRVDDAPVTIVEPRWSKLPARPDDT